MVMFHSYVSLLEGNSCTYPHLIIYGGCPIPTRQLPSLREVSAVLLLPMLLHPRLVCFLLRQGILWPSWENRDNTRVDDHPFHIDGMVIHLIFMGYKQGSTGCHRLDVK